jgi:hypothetical protein
MRDNEGGTLTREAHLYRVSHLVQMCPPFLPEGLYQLLTR